MRRKVAALVQILLFFLAASFSLVAFRHFASSPCFGFGLVKSSFIEWLLPSNSPSANTTVKAAADESNLGSKATGSTTPSGPESSSVLRNGNHSLLQTAPSYIKAIVTPEDDSFSRLACPVPSGGRYNYLRNNATYFFALDLHQCAHLLPRLLGSIVESMRFLGPQNCTLSIVEGRSDDGTFEILKLLREEIKRMGANYFFGTNDVDPKAEGGNRIKSLADLRNQAVQPLVDYADQYSSESTVVFINDVSICMEDILELIHQRQYQKADMTCAMDWTYVGPDPAFYDVWIARGMNGDSFFNVPESGSWDSAWNLFWNNPKAQERLWVGQPFQVFSCWNGAAAFTAKPLLEHKIKFRSPYERECYQGEPQIFCKEMWYLGYGKIAVVPSVNLEYSDEAARKIKAAKGYVSKWVEEEAKGGTSVQVEWETSPPPLVKCIHSWAEQNWVAWDEILGEHDVPP